MNRRSVIGNIFQKHAILLPLATLFLIFSIITPKFIDSDNLINILRQISVLSIISIGSTYVIISGGIDLSVGSIMALVGVFVVNMAKAHAGFLWMILIALAFGLIIGFINGIFIMNFTIPPFIVTLATMTVGRGVVLLLTKGSNVTEINNEAFLFFGRGYIAGIPFPVIVMIPLYIIGAVCLTRSIYGRQIFAVGNNEKASLISGINVKTIKLSVYMIAGFTAAIGAIISTSRMNTVTPMFGSGIEFDCITAVVLGGTVITGGKGSLLNTLFGAALLGIISNGFNLIGISSYWAQIAKGIILISAIMVYNINIKNKQ